VESYDYYCPKGSGAEVVYLMELTGLSWRSTQTCDLACSSTVQPHAQQRWTTKKSLHWEQF